MLESIKDIRFISTLSDHEKFMKNPAINQTRPVFKSLETSELFKQYDEKKHFDIARSIYLIIKLIKRKYQLNEVQEYILLNNIAIALDKYSKFVKTDDLDICIFRNDLGQMYTIQIEEKFINKIKLIIQDQNSLLYQQAVSLCLDDYNLTNHPIFELDIEKMIIDNNINSRDLFDLITCTRDMNLINRYIKLLSSNDLEFNKLLLEFIKPATHYLKNFMYGNNVLNYIKDQNENKSAKKCIELHVLYRKKYQDNLYLIKTFEYYFINRIDELEQIATLKNRCEILRKMLCIKEEILSFRNIYYSFENNIITIKRPDHFETYYVDGPNQFKKGSEYKHLVEGETIYVDNFDMKDEEIDRMYDDINLSLQDIKDGKEVDLDKFKILTRKQLDEKKYNKY